MLLLSSREDMIVHFVQRHVGKKEDFIMKKNYNLVMPQQYTVVNAQEQQDITGGAVSSYSILGFISYLLSGLDVSFGSRNNQVVTDTVGSESHASTGTSMTSGGVTTSVGSSSQHINVDSVSSGRYFNWGADFNLGSLFNAIVRLFM